MKVEINKQSEQQIIEFTAGDVIIKESSYSESAYLVVDCFDGENNWALINLSTGNKWTQPLAKDALLAKLVNYTIGTGNKITVIHSDEAVIKLNI